MGDDVVHRLAGRHHQQDLARPLEHLPQRLGGSARRRRRALRRPVEEGLRLGRVEVVAGHGNPRLSMLRARLPPITPSPTTPISHVIDRGCRTSTKVSRPHDAIQHFAGARDDERVVIARRRATPPDRSGRIAVAQVDPLARRPGMPVASVTRMRGVSTPRDRIERARPFDVRRMREDAARITAEAIPLSEEVVAAVITDLSMSRPCTWLTSRTCGA